MSSWANDMETVSFFMQAALVLLGLHLSVLIALLARWAFDRVAVGPAPVAQHESRSGLSPESATLAEAA